MQVPLVAKAIALGTSAAAVGYGTNYTLAHARNPALPFTGFLGASSVAAGQVMRSSMSLNPRILPLAGLFTGLGAGAVGGAAVGTMTIQRT